MEIRRGLSKELEAETLIHEVLHAIYFQTSLGKHLPVDKDNIMEEKIVTYLSSGLCTFMKQNPKVMKKIMDIYNVV